MKRALVCGAGGFIGGHPSTSHRGELVEPSGRCLEGAVNIGCPQYVTVNELVATVIEVSGKKINVKHVKGPVGVQSRNFSNERIYSLGWRAKVFLKEGISLTYPWIEAQVRAARQKMAEMESQG